MRKGFDGLAAAVLSTEAAILFGKHVFSLRGRRGDVIKLRIGKSELAKAARYSLGRWAALTRYIDDRRIAG